MVVNLKQKIQTHSSNFIKSKKIKVQDFLTEMKQSLMTDWTTFWATVRGNITPTDVWTHDAATPWQPHAQIISGLCFGRHADPSFRSKIILKSHIKLEDTSLQVNFGGVVIKNNMLFKNTATLKILRSLISLSSTVCFPVRWLIGQNIFQKSHCIDFKLSLLAKI